MRRLIKFFALYSSKTCCSRKAVPFGSPKIAKSLSAVSTVGRNTASEDHDNLEEEMKVVEEDN